MWMILLTVLAALLTWACAQDTAPVVGGVTIDPSYWPLVAMFIGWITKEVASPVTALLKKRFGFKGDATRWVYIGLSAFITAAYGFAEGAFGHGGVGLKGAALSLAVAIAKGFGDYDKQVQTSAAGAAAAAQAAPPTPDTSLATDVQQTDTATPTG